MKHRAAAVLAAFTVVAAGALAVPAPATADAAASVTAAASGSTAGGAFVQTVGGAPAGMQELPPPPRAASTDLGDVTPPATGDTGVTGALSNVVDAVIAGTELPDGTADVVQVDGDRIRVEVAFDDEASARAAVDAAGGSEIVTIVDGLLAADVPAAEIAALQADPAVSTVSLPVALTAPPESTVAPANTAGSNGGDVFDKTRIQSWHDIGLNGAGVRVGIVDYFDRETWRDARRNGEVPDASGTFCLWGGKSCNVYDSPSSDIHGVAVAEAIHDMAPKAKLYLATVATREDLRKAIDYFAAKGVRILSRSLGGFYDGPGDGTGPSGPLVAYAVKKGITWINSAGNSGAYTSSYSNGDKVIVGGYWRGKWRDTNGNRWMEFAQRVVDPVTGVPTGAVTYSETMQIACTPYFRLRWNDWGASKPTDFDIYRIEDGEVVSPGYPANDQRTKSDEPLELQDGSDDYFRCTSGWVNVAIYYAANGGASGDILELQGNSGDIVETAVSGYSAGNAFVDSKSRGMAAVGAVDPVAGTQIAGYSSRGPTNDGRIKPEISAGSNFTSRAYTYSGDGGRFNGTSAAAPVVAGAAAVALQRYPSKTPSELVAYLRTHTQDRGAAGVDNVYGTGELVMKAIPRGTFSSTPAPTISGSRSVGTTLSVTQPSWRPAATFSYQWYRGTAAISGATKSTYKLTATDAGHKIRVLATGKRPGFNTEKVYSAYTGAIAKQFTSAPTPKVTGTAKVGRTLSANAGTWSPTPSAIRYQWRADGKAITGATKKSYKVTSSVVGKRITVSVTAERSAYRTTTKTSAKTAKVVR
jgi:hypothetical protein